MITIDKSEYAELLRFKMAFNDSLDENKYLIISPYEELNDEEIIEEYADYNSFDLE